MKMRIRMFSDYICPFCYLGEAIIEKLRSNYDIDLEHVGIEIHPETPDFGVDLRGRISGTAEMYEHLRDRGRRYGINFCDVRILSNSRKALIVGEFARKAGKNEEFTKEIFKAYFESCLDIGKEAVIFEIAERIGLKRSEVKEALENPEYRKTFENNCAEARKYGIYAVPTFIINDEYRITGAQEKQTFVELFQKINKKQPDLSV